ncbi:DoxX family protein [Bacillus sp. 1P06AnD]|uniref:DoxX family protein n=1 Tax=Bacillus sp. 1P06AnD TaxID=3132208 RepID=UPI0039A0758F
MLDTGLLVIRLVIGLLFMGHGAQKLFGSFGGHGIEGSAGWFESIGVKPGVPMAVMAGLSEFGGGLLLAIGLLTPLASLLIVITMVMAIMKVHGANGLWSTQNGYELNLVYMAAVIGIALTGPGKFAVDAFIF